MKISYFPSVHEPKKPKDIHILEALEQIKNPPEKVKEAIGKRGTPEFDELKRNLPIFVFAGTFKERKATGLKKKSGFIVLDFDKFPSHEDVLEFKQNIISDKYTFAAFISPSYKGVKVIVKIPVDGNDHKSYFEALKNYYNSPYWDDKGSDICRPCFLSYDPDIYINEDSDTFIDFKKTPTLPTLKEVIIPLIDGDKILQRLLVWWKRKFGNTKGQRNSNLFILAANCNDFGIPRHEAEQFLLQFSEHDFSEREIRNLTKSAYNNFSSHGTKHFEDTKKGNEIKANYLNGKPKEKIIEHFPEIEPERIEKHLKNVEQLIKTCFWEFDDEDDKCVLLPHLFKFFLQAHGFFKYYPSEKGYIFVRKENNIIEEVVETQIKDYVLSFLLNNEPDSKPYDMMAKNTRYFNSDFLSFLDNIENNFIEDTEQEAYLFYKNLAIKATEKEIKEVDYSDLEGFIWKSRITKRDYKPFDHHDAEFRKFVWLISGQKHDKYKTFQTVIGYNLHSYKSSSNNKACIFNDETISENPNGGAGKGILFNAIGKLKNLVAIDGKTFSFDKSFAYQTVSADCQILVFDDALKNFQFEKLFSVITEGITIEQKNKPAIKIPVQKSPKIIITTNYTIKGNSGSFKRRRFDIEFSSYFNADHTPEMEFGHNLFDDWDSQEWARFDSYMLNCLQIYLRDGLVKSEYHNLRIREFQNETSFDFHQYMENHKWWSGGVFNKRIGKNDFAKKYCEVHPGEREDSFSRRMKRYLEAYCRLYEFQYEEGNTNGQRWFLIRNDKEEINVYENQSEEAAPF